MVPAQSAPKSTSWDETLECVLATVGGIAVPRHWKSCIVASEFKIKTKDKYTLVRALQWYVILLWAYGITTHHHIWNVNKIRRQCMLAFEKNELLIDVARTQYSWLNWRPFSDARLFFCSFVKCSWCNCANALMVWDPSSLFHHHLYLVDLVFIEWITHIIVEACKKLYLKRSYVLHSNVQKVEDHMKMDFFTLRILYIIIRNTKFLCYHICRTLSMNQYFFVLEITVII